MKNSQSTIQKIVLICLLTQAVPAQAGIGDIWAFIRAFISRMLFLSKNQTPALIPVSTSDEEVKQFTAHFCNKLHAYGIMYKTTDYNVQENLYAKLSTKHNRFPSGDMIEALNTLTDNIYYQAYIITTNLNRELKTNLTQEQILQIARQEHQALSQKCTKLYHHICTIDDIPQELLIYASDNALRTRLEVTIREMSITPAYNPYYNPGYDSIGNPRYKPMNPHFPQNCDTTHRPQIRQY